MKGATGVRVSQLIDGSSSKSEARPRGRKVLIVDDEAEIRSLIAMALQEEGYEVVVAPHGAAALSLVEREHPDVILLDLRMPVMDGWQFARTYHARPGPHAPIIVITAARSARESARPINAAAVLDKPFDLDDLLAAVQRVAADWQAHSARAR
jgi:two-component system chemotaxis response regulator CheY